MWSPNLLFSFWCERRSAFLEKMGYLAWHLAVRTPKSWHRWTKTRKLGPQSGVSSQDPLKAFETCRDVLDLCHCGCALVTLPRKASAIAKLRVEKRQKRELMRKIGNYIMPHAYGKIYCAVGSTVQYLYMNINIKILLTDSLRVMVVAFLLKLHVTGSD